MTDDGKLLKRGTFALHDQEVGNQNTDFDSFRRSSLNAINRPDAYISSLV